MFDCVPSAELKMTTKVFNINPQSSYQNHLVCLVLLLPGRNTFFIFASIRCQWQSTALSPQEPEPPAQRAQSFSCSPRSQFSPVSFLSQGCTEVTLNSVNIILLLCTCACAHQLSGLLPAAQLPEQGISALIGMTHTGCALPPEAQNMEQAPKYPSTPLGIAQRSCPRQWPRVQVALPWLAVAVQPPALSSTSLPCSAAAPVSSGSGSPGAM